MAVIAGAAGGGAFCAAVLGYWLWRRRKLARSSEKKLNKTENKMKRHLPDSINIPKLLQNTKPSEWIREFERMLMEKLQLRENQSLLATFSHAFKISLMEFFTDNLTMAYGFEVKMKARDGSSTMNIEILKRVGRSFIASDLATLSNRIRLTQNNVIESLGMLSTLGVSLGVEDLHVHDVQATMIDELIYETGCRLFGPKSVGSSPTPIWENLTLILSVVFQFLLNRTDGKSGQCVQISVHNYQFCHEEIIRKASRLINMKYFFATLDSLKSYVKAFNSFTRLVDVMMNFLQIYNSSESLNEGKERSSDFDFGSSTDEKKQNAVESKDRELIIGDNKVIVVIAKLANSIASTEAFKSFDEATLIESITECMRLLVYGESNAGTRFHTFACGNYRFIKSKKNSTTDIQSDGEVHIQSGWQGVKVSDSGDSDDSNESGNVVRISTVIIEEEKHGPRLDYEMQEEGDMKGVRRLSMNRKSKLLFNLGRKGSNNNVFEIVDAEASDDEGRESSPKVISGANKYSAVPTLDASPIERPSSPPKKLNLPVSKASMFARSSFDKSRSSVVPSTLLESSNEIRVCDLAPQERPSSPQPPDDPKILKRRKHKCNSATLPLESQNKTYGRRQVRMSQCRTLSKSPPPPIKQGTFRLRHYRTFRKSLESAKSLDSTKSLDAEHAQRPLSPPPPDDPNILKRRKHKYNSATLPLETQNKTHGRRQIRMSQCRALSKSPPPPIKEGALRLQKYRTISKSPPPPVKQGSFRRTSRTSSRRSADSTESDRRSLDSKYKTLTKSPPPPIKREFSSTKTVVR